jgi:hypothetical protein
MAVAHPQVTIAGLLAVGVALVVARSRVLWTRYLVSLAAVLLSGGAIYARGLPYKQIPLGWPPMEAWRSRGFGPDMAATFYWGGELLDHARPPVLTCAWAAALVALAFRARQPIAGSVLAGSIAAAVFTVSGGPAVVTLGSLAPILTQVLMPARMLAVVPFAAAAAIVVATDAGLAWLEGWSGRDDQPTNAKRRRLLAELLPIAVILIGALYCSPGSAHVFYEKLAAPGDEGFVEASCASEPTGPFDADAAGRWIHALDRGRFEIDAHAPFAQCRRVEPLRLESPVPVGRGPFPGILMAAFANVRPWLPGSAARAESLGIRELLRGRLSDEAIQTGWRVRESDGNAVLAERVGGTDTVGVGCVDEVWSGTDDALREAILDDLQLHARVLYDPGSLVALEHTKGPMTTRPVDHGSCASGEARVFERHREPGAFEATVDTPTDVDVVVRATDFPTWRVTVDGAPAIRRSIAPGFFATRVGPGRHEVLAVFAPIPFYLGGIVLALVLVGALSRLVL